MLSRKPSRRQQWLERILLGLAVLSLGWYGLRFAETRLYQFQQGRALDARLRGGIQVPVGLILGRVEIPSIGLSAIIREGDDAKTLRLAVGHLPGTARPGEAGNAALAGHRDTFFRKLRDVKPDDQIFVTTSSGVFRYRVDSTRVVDPEDVWVLNKTKDAVLTLVTCYPFSYVGTAPERFIVQATLKDRLKS